MAETYFSCDIEADGPIPGPNSMLSFGSAAYDGTSLQLVDTFEANLEQLEGATPDPDTMAWWAKNEKAWTAHRQNTQHPEYAMRRFVEWVTETCKGRGQPVFVGYPAGFDFLFIYWYLIRFETASPFSFAAVDMKTMAMVLMKTGFRDISKRKMVKRWPIGKEHHTHIALDDAKEQGQIFCGMMREMRSR